jgi:hypothetical protein
MKSLSLCWNDGKTGALTISWDDGGVADRQLVAILNKFGLKGIWNLNSGRFGMNISDPYWRHRYVLTDINNQLVIEDPYQIIANWKARLSVYPSTLKKAILDKNLASLRYWRSDYH